MPFVKAFDAYRFHNDNDYDIHNYYVMPNMPTNAHNAMSMAVAMARMMENVIKWDYVSFGAHSISRPVHYYKIRV